MSVYAGCQNCGGIAFPAKFYDGEDWFLESKEKNTYKQAYVEIPGRVPPMLCVYDDFRLPVTDRTAEFPDVLIRSWSRPKWQTCPYCRGEDVKARTEVKYRAYMNARFPMDDL